MKQEKMSSEEIRSTLTLGLIFFLRMFGLFLILPVFSLFALDIDDATPTLVGFALGVYGLTQAAFQIPFGMLSDRFGRKPMILFGLLLFIIGSLIAGFSNNIYVLIIGRALQGAGAIASVVMALAADLITEQHRTKAMALIGISVGLAFFLAFLLGPFLSHYIGFSGLFFLTAILAVFAIIALLGFVPNTKSEFHQETELSMAELIPVISNKVLVGFDIGIFILHLVLMANFVVIPLILLESIGLHTAHHWQIYLPVMLLAIFIMAPFVIIADRKQLGPKLYTMMIGVLLLSQIGFIAFNYSTLNIFINMTLFFVAFNFLEASLPSLISKSVNPKRKGTALGVYSSSQFIGAFIGGVAGGFLFGSYGFTGVFILCAICIIFWLIIALFLQVKLENTYSK